MQLSDPYLSQYPLKKYLEENQIAVQAWSPLGRGAVLNDPSLKEIAGRYEKTTAQIVLRWHLQQNTLIIRDVAIIDGLNKDQRTGPDPDREYLTI